jgi:hypothetical protein
VFADMVADDTARRSSAEGPNDAAVGYRVTDQSAAHRADHRAGGRMIVAGPVVMMMVMVMRRRRRRRVLGGGGEGETRARQGYRAEGEFG